MTVSLKRILLQAFVIPGTVFCASTIPLAVFGSERVAIEFRDEPIFTGQLRQIASPYLALATTISIGAGLAGIATSGWRQSHQRSTRVEEQLSALKQALKEKEIEIENIKLSDSRLAAFGLSSFMEDKTVPNLAVEAEVTPATPEAEVNQNNNSNSTVKPVQSTNGSSNYQIEELCSQLETLSSHFALLQQGIQKTQMAVANSQNARS
jgi:hypothetical protein